MRLNRAALLVGLAATAAMTVPAHAGTKNSGSAGTQTCKEGTVSLNGPTSLWPPNHKAVNETVVAVGSAAPLMPVTLDLMITSNEAADAAGSGHTPVDISVGNDSDSSTDSATVPFTVLAERSGTGSGRVYQVDWTAHWQDGTTCSSIPAMDGDMDASHVPFLIAVPHDQGQGND